MLTIDEAIKRYEEKAETKERSAKLHQRPDKGVKGNGKRYLSCIKCAKEHRQIAELLRELKELREKLTEIEEAVNCYMGCETSQGFSEYPTSKFVNDLVRILEVNADENSN